MERYWDEGNEGKQRCQFSCFVGTRKCICEGVSGHAGEHERIPTLLNATLDDLISLPSFKSFKQVNQSD